MTQTNKDIPTFQLPGESSGTGSNEATATDVSFHESTDTATYSEASWSQEETATASTTTEYPADIENFIKVAWMHSDALERLRRDALGE